MAHIHVQCCVTALRVMQSLWRDTHLTDQQISVRAPHVTVASDFNHLITER